MLIALLLLGALAYGVLFWRLSRPPYRDKDDQKRRAAAYHAGYSTRLRVAQSRMRVMGYVARGWKR
jgi:hypothetical protein